MNIIEMFHNSVRYFWFWCEKRRVR